MIKIINLGYEVPETGETRVDLLHEGLIKTASNEIQQYWAKLDRDPDKAYLHVIAMTDSSKYGPNNNGDWFEGSDLRKYHPTFVESAHVFLHHINKDPKKSIGKPIYSFYNENMARVELILELDKKSSLAQETIRKIKNGDQIFVSMGVHVAHDVCSICANSAKTRREYCFVGDTLITMYDGTVKPITDVAIGDKVLDAQGKIVEVIETFKNHVIEDLITYKTTLNGLTSKTTKNHPILISNREDFGKCFYQVNGNAETISCLPSSKAKCVDCKKNLDIQKDFVPAGEIRLKDIIYSPFHSKEYFIREDFTEEDAWVFGLFMAEGSYGKQTRADGSRVRASLQFTINGETESAFAQRLEKYFWGKHGKEIKTYPSKGDNKAVSIRIHSKDLSEKYFNLLGEYADKKSLSESIFFSNKPLLLAFINGLWDGDGYSPTRDGRRITSRLNSASQNLVHQTSLLLNMLGHDSYFSTAINVGGPSDRTNKTAVHYVATDYRQPLLLEKENGHGSSRGRTDTHLVGYITDLSKEQYDGLVYNFETTSGTYVANGVAVHNCDHLKYNMKKILTDGRQVYAKNPGPLKFFDISVVGRPADRVAWALDKAAAEGACTEDLMEKDSAELGEDFERHQACLSGLRKLSEMIKQIDGDITELKDGDENINVLRRMKDLKIKHLDYPTLEPKDMDDLKVSPGCMLRSILGHGVAPSLGEIVHMAGRNRMGDEFKEEHIPEVLKLVPGMLRLLMHNPERILPEMSSLYHNYNNELENPEIVIRISRAVAPVASRRIIMIKKACDMKQLEKLAAPVLNSLPENRAIINVSGGSGVNSFVQNLEGRAWSPHGPGMAESFHVEGPNGKILTTNRAAAMTAQDINSVSLIAKQLIGVAAGTAALGAAVSEPSLLRLLLTVPALGFLAAHMLKGSSPQNVRTMEGVEIPVGTVFSQVQGKTALDKTAGVSDIFKAQPGHLAPLMGMAVPSGLGLDYLYNRHIKYPGVPEPEMYMSPARRRIYSAGETVAEHPFLSLTGGALAGSIARAQILSRKAPGAAASASKGAAASAVPPASPVTPPVVPKAQAPKVESPISKFTTLKAALRTKVLPKVKDPQDPLFV
jgi:intein/homing endonuclease